MTNIPTEIWTQVCGELSCSVKVDTRNFRLTCKRFDSIGREHLFRVIHVRIRKKSLEHIRLIAECDDLAHLVHELNICPEILRRIMQTSSLQSKIIGEINEKGGLNTVQNLVYSEMKTGRLGNLVGEWEAIYNEQEEIISDLMVPELQHCIPRLPAVTALSFYKSSVFVQWGILFHDHANPDTTAVFSRIVSNALNSLSESVKLRHLSIEDFGSELFEVLDLDLLRPKLQSLRALQLTANETELSPSPRSDPLFQVKNISKLINLAEQLRVLRVSFSPAAEADPFLAMNLGMLPDMLQLNFLRRITMDEISIDGPTFVDFLERHRASLQHLELSHVAIRHIPLVDFLSKLGSRTSLTSISFQGELVFQNPGTYDGVTLSDQFLEFFLPVTSSQGHQLMKPVPLDRALSWLVRGDKLDPDGDSDALSDVPDEYWERITWEHLRTWLTIQRDL